MWTRVLPLGLLFCALQGNAQRLINVDFGAHTNPSFTTKTGQAATGLSNTDSWNLYSRDGANGEFLSSSQLLNLKLSTGASTDADLYVSGAPGAWYVPNPDAMFQSYLYPGNPNIQITFSNVPPSTYDIYVYAHGEPAAENSVIEVSSGGVSFGQKATSSAANWDQPGWGEGNEYVVFRNVEIGVAPLSVLVRPGVASMSVINGIQLLEKAADTQITISQQPATAYATIGGAGEFAVTASSPLPLSYQWFFKGGALTNETNSVLHITNASQADTGSYFVTVSNSGNSLQSTNAFLLLYTEVTDPLLNIDFGAHLNPFLFEKTGPAVIGNSLTDEWNLYSRDGEDGSWLDNNSLTNLIWSDGTASGVRIDVSNAAGAWAVLHPDAMFHSYLYPISRAGNINAVLSGMPSGTYDVYVYAHGAPAHENAVVQLTTPSTDFGIKVTSSDSDWNDTPWTEGDHYLVFTNVHIRSGETLNVSSKPGQSGLAVINGLQLLQKSTNPPATITITTQPRDQIIPAGGTAEFSVVVTNDPPIAYQWFFNNNPIPTGTNPVLRIENVSSSDAGAYTVQISAGTASVISDQARLQIFTPVAGPLLNIDYGAHLNPYLPTNVGPAAVGIAVDDRWNLYSRDGSNGIWLANNSLRDLVWSDGTPSSISINVTNASGAWYTWNPNPMFKSYLYPGIRRGNIGSVISNLPAGTFDIYVYAHGEIPGENGVIEVSTPASNYGIKSTSSAAGWDTAAWTEGNHFVLFKNVILNGSEPLRIVARPGVNGLAVINGVQIVKKMAIPGSEIVVQNQPLDAVLPAGTPAELSVTASSGLPLAYQWYRNGTPIPGATSPTLSIASLLPSDAGEYRVVVRNSENSVTSRTAAVKVYTPIEAPLLNIDFGAHQNPVFTTNVGPSAFGMNLDDRWNLYSRDDGNFGWRSDGVLTDLLWSDGTNSNIQLEVSNAAGAWYTDPLDPMFQSYLYPLSRQGNISANLANLPTGRYDLAVYAHGEIPSENGVITVATESADYGTKTNSAASDWNPGYWANGRQFVIFTNIAIAAGETLQITSQPGVSGLSVINGVQLILLQGTRPDAPSPVAPFIIEQPQSRNATVGGSALFSVTAGGSAPLTYQWKFNGSNIAGANLSVLALSNLTVTRAGSYSVEISNSIGQTNSAPALLTIVEPHFDRTIALADTDPVQEGSEIDIPLLVSSSGDIGALSFIINYDTNYLAEPELDWKNQQHGAFTQVNTDTAGAIHATYVLPGKTFRAGDEEELATVTFRTRSVPESLTTPVTLVLNGVYSDAGDPITSGTAVESTEIRITRREYIGDNNANDRLDVGDATAMIRMLTLLDPIRAWDVSGNDLNENSSLDAGDIVRVLRAVVNRDPQPGEQHGRLAALTAQPLTPATSLTADRTRLTAGQKVRVQVNLALPGYGISGASFVLDYPQEALRLEAAPTAGSIVPQNAFVLWNGVPEGTNTSEGVMIYFAASTATPWSTSSGSIAELTFTVLDDAATRYAWPIRLVRAEAGTGIEVLPLAPAQLILTGRDAQAAEFDNAALKVATDGFELRLTGEPHVRYQIESSTNLTDWQNIGVYSDADGEIIVKDAVTTGGHKFYRAIQID